MQGGKHELLSERAANRSWALKRQNAGLKDGAADFPTSKKGLKSAVRQKKNKKGGDFRSEIPSSRRRLPTLPQCAVPSAMPGLTSLFGMGRGGAPAP